MGHKTDQEPRLDVWQSTSDPRIKRRNGQLYARFTKLGIRIEQRLHETNLKAAQKAADRIEECVALNRELHPKQIILKVRALFGHESEPEEKAVLIGELWPKFYAFRCQGSKIHKLTPWREKTQKEYESFWNRSFKPFWEYKLPTQIEGEWQAFIDAERKRSRKGADLSFACHTKYFQAFTSYLVQEKILVAKPLIWNPDPEPSETDEGEDGEGIVIPDHVIQLMLKESAKQPAFHLFLRMKAFMGMRSSEITQLKKDRIQIPNMAIKLRAIDVKTGSRTKKGRIVPIHPEVVESLKVQMVASGGSPYLFPNQRDENRPMDKTGFYGHWDELRKVVEMPGITPHDMRHSYATKIFSNPNVNPLLACRALGMSMQTAEKVYIHFDEKHLSIVTDHFRIADSDGSKS